MVLSTETFNQSVRTEYSEAVNARYTFQPLWVSDKSQGLKFCQSSVEQSHFQNLEGEGGGGKRFFYHSSTLKEAHA